MHASCGPLGSFWQFQPWTDSDVESLKSVDSGLPSGVEESSDGGWDTTAAWAKSARCVWGLANIFEGNLCFT